MRGERVGKHGDEGFSLIEMLMALTVLSVTMTGLGTVFVNGSLAVAQQRDQRNASVIASNVLEQIRALEESALLDGRGQTLVDKQFQDASTGPFKDKLKPYFDNMKADGIAGVTGGENAALPTERKTSFVSGTEFGRTVFVGPCEVYLDLDDDSCVRPLEAGNPKRPDDLWILQYFRVVVLIDWKNNGCTANAERTCVHIASTLISRKADEGAFSNKRSWPDIWPPYMKTFYRNFDKINVKMNVRGGNLPNHWTAVNLPDGLKIDELTGNITGTPTKVGTWSYATTGTYLRVVENEAPAGSVSPRADQDTTLTWKVVDLPALTLATAPTNKVGDAVNLKLLTGGVGPFTLAAEPALPAGLTLNPDGSITGTATQTYTTTVTVADFNDMTASLTFTHTVQQQQQQPPLALTPVPDKQVPVLSTVNIPVVATGGDGTYTYSATGLPAELAINPATGVITGLPVLTPGRYLPVVTVKDGQGVTATGTFVLEVTSAGGLKFTAPTGNVTTPRNQPVDLTVATNAMEIGAYATQVDVVSLLTLPPGVTWNRGTKTFTGTPTVPGAYVVTLTANSVAPVTANALYTFVWTVS
ncbi:putative Ig domain-containing protein [Actinoplanes sp. NPDC023801]|uniref:putative Ig domain-containing protein n=1 Tax=Actinoplanes sp. NPDC023801 TaxID=3154595 RepID=UPI0033FDFEF6